MGGPDFLLRIVLMLPALIISFVIHEMAHGYAAYIFGDPTAKYQGRLSPDPRIHIDPFGAIVLLGSFILSGGTMTFGWAKPVSVNPNNFKNPRQDMAWVAFAGPLSNFTLAAIFGLLIKFQLISNMFLFYFIFYFVMVNIGLGVFNMVPFPPLDGSKILYGILPSDISYKLMQMERQYAHIIPFVFILLIGTRMLDPIIGPPFIFLLKTFTGM